MIWTLLALVILAAVLLVWHVRVQSDDIWSAPPAPAPAAVEAETQDSGEGKLIRSYTDAALFKRIWSEASPYRLKIAALFLLELLGTPLLLLTPLPVKIGVDSVLHGRPLPGFIEPLMPAALTRSTLGLLVAAALLQVLVVLLYQLQAMTLHVLRTHTGEKMTLGFRARLFRHIQRLSLSFHDARGSADSLYRIQWDAPAIQNITIYGLITFVSSTLMLIGTVYVTARIDWQLALVALIVMPLLFMLGRYYNQRMRPRYHDVAHLESSALSVLQEVLTATRVVKAFGREDSEQQRFVRHSGETIHAQVRLSFFEASFGLLINVVTAIGTALVLFLGIRNVASGVLTLGELLVIIAYLTMLYGPLQTISKQVTDTQGALVSVERTFELLDEVPEVDERPHARPIARASGRLELRHVTFAYDDHYPVLRDVSFQVEPSTRVGIAGRTGAGKTTLVNLLTRFYDPQDGEILLDGIDLRDYKLADLRNQFAIVLQDPVLFSTSVAENIAYARPEAGRAEVEAAARAANAHDFILALPDGYDTLVGERGMRLSGGERQRISLARAFLKDAPILILDEPTSAVDIETEAAILDSMERLMAGRTSLMIAHRLSTLESCDMRLEVAGGRVSQVPVRSTGAATELVRSDRAG